MRRLIFLAFITLSSLGHAADPVTEAMEGYFDFADYGGGVVTPAQIVGGEWKSFYLIDTRSPERAASGKIPGAVNIEWRQLLARRQEVPRNRLVLVYCDSGMLSAQAHFALRVAGYDNLRLLQGGMVGWKAQGGPTDTPSNP
jgi:rhodanese-related sulfurtransferase